MAAFCFYWSDSQCQRSVERGDEGRPLTALWGAWNQITSGIHKVEVGDEVLVVAYAKGFIYLLGDLDVLEAEDSTTWFAKHPHERKRFAGLSGRVVAGKGRAPMRLDLAVPPTWLNHWTFLYADGRARPVRRLQNDRLTSPISFQGYYRLSDATMQKARELLGAKFSPPVQALLSDDRTLAALEKKLARVPQDKDTAEVYADALMDRGDPRGDVLRQELQTPTSSQNKRALKSLFKAHNQALLGRPGGYPFRLSWAPHKKLLR